MAHQLARLRRQHPLWHVTVRYGSTISGPMRIVYQATRPGRETIRAASADLMCAYLQVADRPQRRPRISAGEEYDDDEIEGDPDPRPATRLRPVR